jgi:hypothetical protein
MPPERGCLVVFPFFLCEEVLSKLFVVTGRWQPRERHDIEVTTESRASDDELPQREIGWWMLLEGFGVYEIGSGFLAPETVETLEK